MNCSRLGILCSLLLAMPVQADDPHWPLLRGCEDESGWAPFSFSPTAHDGATDLQGFSIDVWNSLELPVEKTELHAMPWLRCLAEVEHGKDYQLSLSASIKPDRVGRFLFSDAYYSTQLHYFFDPRRFAPEIEFSSQSELSRYRVCGVAGHQYRGIDPRMLPVDQGARDLGALFKLLELGRCDFVLSAIEVVQGQVLAEAPRLLQPPLASRPMPGVPPERYHMLISMQLPNADQLVRLIDQGLQRLRQSGEMQRLRERWKLPDETPSRMAEEP